VLTDIDLSNLREYYETLTNNAISSFEYVTLSIKIQNTSTQGPFHQLIQNWEY
jgi:ribosome-associated toxin RatA of RatAB toxin-antitoxin module